MRKRFKTGIMCILILISILLVDQRTKLFINAAPQTGRVEVIFNEEAYLKNEKIQITFNLLNISDLYEADIHLKIDERQVLPQKQGSNYFCLNALAIFEEEPIINDYVDNTYLRLKLIKNSDIGTGYTVSGKNNLANVYLISCLKIENIFNLFNESNINITLYNTLKEEIPFELHFSEKLKYNWPNENYEMEVYSKIIAFQSDIVVTNRQQAEYSLTIDHDINPLIVGDYNVMLIIYDQTNGEIIKESKKVKVIDKTPPTITSNITDTLIINDYEIKEYDFSAHFRLIDNYDPLPTLEYAFYDENGQAFLTEGAFKKYLENHLKASIVIWGTDTSHNISNKITIPLQINDTTAPVIECEKEIAIDLTITDFDINDYLTITDNYDLSPEYSLTFFNEQSEIVFNFQELAKNCQFFSVKVLAFDASGNYSDEEMLTFRILDNVSPEIIANDILLLASNISKFDFFSTFLITDNYSSEIFILIKVYNYEEELLGNIQKNYNLEFQNYLVNYQKFKIIIEAEDSANNKATSRILEIIVEDDIGPVIQILNLENNKKYEFLESISYLVTDNYDEEPNVQIFLNDLPYLGNSITKSGVYNLKIIAIDSSLNETIAQISFEIAEETQVFELPMASILTKEASLMIIIGLLSISFIILIIRIINFYHDKNKNKSKN